MRLAQEKQEGGKQKRNKVGGLVSGVWCFGAGSRAETGRNPASETSEKQLQAGATTPGSFLSQEGKKD